MLCRTPRSQHYFSGHYHAPEGHRTNALIGTGVPKQGRRSAITLRSSDPFGATSSWPPPRATLMVASSPLSGRGNAVTGKTAQSKRFSSATACSSTALTAACTICAASAAKRKGSYYVNHGPLHQIAMNSIGSAALAITTTRHIRTPKPKVATQN